MVKSFFNYIGFRHTNTGTRLLKFSFTVLLFLAAICASLFRQIIIQYFSKFFFCTVMVQLFQYLHKLILQYDLF